MVGFVAKGVDFAAEFLGQKAELAAFAGSQGLAEVLNVRLEADLFFVDVNLFDVKKELLLPALHVHGLVVGGLHGGLG